MKSISRKPERRKKLDERNHSGRQYGRIPDCMLLLSALAELETRSIQPRAAAEIERNY
jgi:hypothetical protein